MPRVRDADRVRLITRGGYDWIKRFPWIVETALKNRQKRVDNQADDNDAVLHEGLKQRVERSVDVAEEHWNPFSELSARSPSHERRRAYHP